LLHPGNGCIFNIGYEEAINETLSNAKF